MMSRKYFKAAIGAATLAVFAMTAVSTSAPTRPQETKAQASSSFLDSLPADTTILVRVRSWSDLEQKLKASPFYELRQHPDIKRFLDDIQKKLEQGVAPARAQLGFNPLDLCGLIEGEAVFAVGGLDTIAAALAQQIAGGKGDVKPGDVPLVLAVDAGASAPKLRENLGKLFDFALKEGGKKGVEDFRGGKITTLTTKPKAPPTNDELEKLFFGDLGSKVLVSINRPYLEQIMANLTAPAAGSLAKDADFAATQREIRSDADVTFFLNIRPIMAAARRHLQTNPMASMIWALVEGKVLGRGLKNAGVSVSLRENGIQQLAFVNNGGLPEGIFGVLKGPPFPSKPPSLIPEDVDTYFTISLNIPQLYSLIKDVANMVFSMRVAGNGPGGAVPMPDAEAFIEQSLGLKPQPVINALGNLIHFYQRGVGVGQPGLGSVGNFTIALELKDEMPIRDLLSRLSPLMGVLPEKYLDRDYYAFGGMGADEGGPALALADKLLVVGLKGDSVKEVIRRAGKGGKGLAQSPAYQPLAGLAPPQVTILSYQSAKAFRDSLATIKTVMDMMAVENLAVPDLTMVADLVAGALGYAVWKDQGYFSESITAYKKGRPPQNKAAK